MAENQPQEPQQPEQQPAQQPAQEPRQPIQLPRKVSNPAPPPRRFKTGARPSPAHKILRAPKFTPPALRAGPTVRVPKKLSMWGNDQMGDCVSAEEGCNAACWNPEYDLTDETVIRWAQRHGWDNGATLTEVLDAMVSEGMSEGQANVKDGPYASVDYSQPTVLGAAIAVGPVKIAIDHSALPGDAGSRSGWYAVGGSPHQFRDTDHCVGLTSAAKAGDLYRALGVALPSELQPDQMGYLLFTWSTLGFVDDAWIMSTTTEAWVRNPSSIISGGPTPPPGPGPGPGPGPSPFLTCLETVWADLRQMKVWSALLDFVACLEMVGYIPPHKAHALHERIVAAHEGRASLPLLTCAWQLVQALFSGQAGAQAILAFIECIIAPTPPGGQPGSQPQHSQVSLEHGQQPQQPQQPQQQPHPEGAQWQDPRVRPPRRG